MGRLELLASQKSHALNRTSEIMEWNTPADRPIDSIGDKREDHCHIEAISHKGPNASVTEEENLDGEGDGNADHCRPGAQHNGKQPAAYGMSGGSVGDGYVVHHDDKGKGRSDGHQGTYLDFSQLLTFLTAVAQMGTMATPKVIQVPGLK